MKTITKIFSTVFLVLLLVLGGCKDSELSRMPSLSLSSADSTINKTLRLNLKTTIDGTLRTVNISAEQSNGIRKLNLDLSSLTWNNEDNKPQIWVFVYDSESDKYKSFKVKETEYNYYPAKDQKAPTVDIFADIEYLSDVPISQQSVRLYIFDKSLNFDENKVTHAKKITNFANLYNKFKKGSESYYDIPILEPLNKLNQRVGYKILYSMVMPLQEIVDNSHSIIGKKFSPIGTMMLFSIINDTGAPINYPSRILLHSNVVIQRFNEDFDFRKGFSKDDCVYFGNEYIIDNGGKRNLNNGEESYIYGIYTSVSSKEEVADDRFIDITVLNKKDQIMNVRGAKNRIIVLPSDYKNILQSKFVNIPAIGLKKYDDRDYTKLEFKGTDVIYLGFNFQERRRYWPTDLCVQYRVKGGGPWIDGKMMDLKGIYLYNLFKANVSSYNTYEVRFAGCAGFDMRPTYLKDLPSLAKSMDGLRKITQWGTDKYLRLVSAFQECRNLEIDTNTVPDLSMCDDLSWMFSNVNRYNINDDATRSNFRGHPSMSRWDLSHVKNLGYMFYGSKMNTNVNDWNVSNVTKMNSLFACCKEFNQPLDKWNVSNVTDMEQMFYLCEKFDQPLGKWDVSNVTTMDKMFYYCLEFNQSLDKWDVSNVTDMGEMFYHCKKYNKSLSGWYDKLDKVEDMHSMFYWDEMLNQDFSSWVLKNSVYTTYMFYSTPMQNSYNLHPQTKD